MGAIETRNDAMCMCGRLKKIVGNGIRGKGCKCGRWSEILISTVAVFLMQSIAKAALLQYPPPPLLTPQLITAASAISTRLYGLFDLGVFIAKLVETGVQRYGEPLDPCWLYVALPNGYKHFAYFSNDAPEAAEYASLLPGPLPWDAVYSRVGEEGGLQAHGREKPRRALRDAYAGRGLEHTNNQLR
jgi:hypothetical protein